MVLLILKVKQILGFIWKLVRFHFCLLTYLREKLGIAQPVVEWWKIGSMQLKIPLFSNSSAIIDKILKMKIF